MTYYQFVQIVEDRLREELKERVRVSTYTADKYNGTRRKGILFREEDSNVSPTIYLEEYYRRFEMGDTIDAIVKEILVLYGKIRLGKPWREGLLTDYEEVRNRIVYRLINHKENEKLLREMPHVPYLDLAIVFYVLLEAGDSGTATMPVKYEQLKRWKVTQEQVYRQACENTWKLFPYEFKTMGSVIAEMTDIEEKEGEDALYILTNHYRSFGAASMLYSGCLKKIGDFLGEDYYVLPSSVHEVIIIRKSASPGKAVLSAMVAEINGTHVEKEEVLSNRAYYFDSLHHKLRL